MDTRGLVPGRWALVAVCALALAGCGGGEDAVAGFAGRPLAEGRAAIEETLNANIEEGGTPQITIHEVAAVPIGDGSFFGAGWYEMASSAGNQIGNYVLLALPDAEGNMQIQWSVSNGIPDPR